MKKGERVYKVLATRTTKCMECHGYIYAGQPLLIDKIPYVERSRFGTKTRIKNHLIHPHHWRPHKGAYIIDLTKRKPRAIPC